MSPFSSPLCLCRFVSLPLKFLISLGLGVLAANLGAGENLIKNPSLEEADPQTPASPLGYGNHIRQGTNKVDRKYQWVDGGRSSKKAFKCEVQGESAMIAPSLNAQGWESNTLYRYSVWYRTEHTEPEASAIRVNPSGFPYPTTPIWTRASVLFKYDGKIPGLGVAIQGFRDGQPAYEKDAQGKLVKDAQGRQHVTNALSLTVYLDDFELRKATEDDYRGNLIDNPGFEEGLVGNMAPGYWNMYNPGKCPGFIDESMKYSGQRSLRIECWTQGSAGTTFSPKAMPAHPGDVCTFGLWARSSLRGQQMRLRVDTNGRKWWDKVHWLKYNLYEVGTEWTHLWFTFEIPPAEEMDCDPEAFLCQLTFRPEVSKPCRVWVDDAEFVIETHK